MNNKEKNTRIVTFEEDYTSQAGTKSKEGPIYKKGSTHAIHASMVKKLEEKGAKMKVEKLDVDAGIKRIQKAKKANKEKDFAVN